MLEFFRTHRRLMQIVLLLLIVPSFLFFGVSDYLRGNNDPVVAKVAGVKITKNELEFAHQKQMARLRNTYGEQFDSRLFDTPEARQQVLEQLIIERALIAEAARNNLTVSDQALREFIAQQWQTEDGKFDRARYDAFRSQEGMSVPQFEAYLRQLLVQQKLLGAIESTAFVTQTVTNQLSNILAQQREVQELAFPTADFIEKVQVTDEMLKEYYENQGTEFAIPEQVTAQYLVLDAAAVASQVNVSDADIEQYYQQNADKRFGTEEQRRASHILITAPASASSNEKQAAKAKAEQLLQQLRSNPASFAEVAKQHSQDPGSAGKGGDLGYFGRGMMVKPFEETVFQLKEGEISNVVETDFGYHIIQVTGVRPGGAKPLAEVKDEIAAELREQQAARKISELTETLTSITYEQSESLKPAAEKLNLEVKTVSGLKRQPDPALPPDAPYNNPEFLAALFSDDVLKGKNNTDVIEVAPATRIVGRVVEHKAAGKRPFEEVKSLIRERVIQREAAKLAQQAGEAKLAELKAGDAAAAEFGEPKTVTREDSAGIRGAAYVEVMKADTTKLPVYVGVTMPNGYSIYRINKVTQPESTDAGRRALLNQQLEGLRARQETEAYVDALKKKAKVENLLAGEGK